MATAAAVAMIGSTLAISSAASAGGNPAGTPAAAKTFRVSGENRNATAVDAAAGITNAPTEITVVNGLDFPDGLAAAGLSIGGAVPTLLTEADAIPADTLAYIKALQAANANQPNITVVGGTAVVSSAVLEQLDALNGSGTVTRIFGANRYATALAVATETLGNGTSVIIATGLNPADALSAGPLAIDEGAPIILNDGGSLRADVRAFLVAKSITDVTIVGGTSAVPQSVQDELFNDLGITVHRLDGATRDATAAKIAAVLDANNGLSDVVLVNRTGFADSLAGGPLTNALSGAILTVGVDSLPAATAAFLAANCDAITTVTAIGGTAVISDEVLAAAAAATKCTVPGISSAALTITKTTQRIMYIADGATVAADDTAPSLTSVAGSAASGSAAGNFQVEFKDAVGAPSVEIDITVFPVVITYTDNFTGIVTPAEFVATWNASVAKDFFKAAVGTVVTDFDTKPTDTATPGQDDVAGSYDATLVVTFDQAVYGAVRNTAPVGVVNNNSSTVNANTDVMLGGGSTVTPAAVVPTAGVITVTQTWTGQTTAVPTANATVRYAIGGVSNLANNQANVAVTMKTITVN